MRQAEGSSGTEGQGALGRLMHREEVLQICFWYQGEGFGEVFSPQALMPFLSAGQDDIRTAFAELVGADEMRALEHGFAFTPAGRRKAGRLFAEAFTDFQQAGHGECNAGCCESEQAADACAHHDH